MSSNVIDNLFRVDEICKRYDKYDIDKHRNLNSFGDDAFLHLYAVVEADIESALRKAEMASVEKNRAAVVAMYAEIRRTKVKRLSKEDLATRHDLTLALAERIQVIPDGTTSASKQTWGWGASSSRKNIKFDSSDGNFGSDFFDQTEESSQFKQEYEMRKMKQDQGLDFISEGLDTLKNLAHDMNEELDRQVPLVDEIDAKVDRATSDLKNTNVRLKETLTKLRSSQNFCIDIILLCIVLGIVAYLYNILN